MTSAKVAPVELEKVSSNLGAGGKVLTDQLWEAGCLVSPES